jgi:hypothetical protein
MKLVFSLIFTSLIAFSSLFAQWAEVNTSDFDISQYTEKTEKGAIVLFRKGRINPTKNFTTEEESKRILILNESGLNEYGTFTVFIRRSDDEIQNLVARTLNLENGQIVESKVPNRSWIKQKYNDKLDKIEFAFPNAKVGSILEFYLNVSSRRTLSFTWYFQEDAPTLLSELKFRPEIASSYSTLFQGLYQDYLKSEVNNGIGIFRMEYVPGIKEEEFVPNVDDYCPKMQFQRDSYFNGIGYSNIFPDWESFTKEILKDPQLGTYFRSYKGMTKELVEEAQSISDPFLRMQWIYRELTKKLFWNGSTSIITKDSRSLSAIYKSQEGNSGEVNLVLAKFLSNAGLDAHPILCSTIENGDIFKEKPFVNQFNTIAVWVKINDKAYVLDGSNPYTNIRLAPEELINQEGWVLSKKNGHWHRIGSNEISMETHVGILTLNENGLVSGTMKTIITGYYQSWLEKMDSKELEEEMGRQIQEKVPGAFLRNFSSKNDSIFGLSTEFQFEAYGLQSEAGKMITVDLFSIWRSGNPFPNDNRVFPIDMGFPYMEKLNVQFIVPEGYKIVSYPKSVKISLPGNEISYLLQITQIGENRLSIGSIFNVVNTYYPPLKYESLKQVFDEKILREEEPIVLKKKEGK